MSLPIASSSATLPRQQTPTIWPISTTLNRDRLVRFPTGVSGTDGSFGLDHPPGPEALHLGRSVRLGGPPSQKVAAGATFPLPGDTLLPRKPAAASPPNRHPQPHAMPEVSPGNTACRTTHGVGTGAAIGCNRIVPLDTCGSAGCGGAPNGSNFTSDGTRSRNCLLPSSRPPAFLDRAGCSVHCCQCLKQEPNARTRTTRSARGASSRYNRCS